ncbi:MAG TPA: glycosyltransferase [Gammaproteobacteria bacterium]|nr:glycosyltransferase [Gammaproteobacteria bacterium]
MNTPLVSIVLPYRDAAATLDACLRSVFAQRFTDFELLAINDHSTDDSLQRVNTYRQQDPRLRCLNSPRKGLVAALNFGLHEARGTFIARMDADDLMRPERLQQQVAALQQHSDWALVASQVKLFPEHSIQAGYREYIRWQNQCLTAEDIAADIYRESPFAHPSVMFRKTDVLQLGAYREGDFAEDYDLWLRMFQAGLRMAKLPQVLLDWRDSPDRLSRVDPRCSQQAFDRLRAHYLAKDPRLQSCFVIWGAGRKTRLRCRPLLEQGLQPVAWIDIDPAKIGNTLQGVPVVAPDWLLHRQPAPLVLVYVRNHGAYQDIAAFLESAAYRHGHNFLFVG